MSTAFDVSAARSGAVLYRSPRHRYPVALESRGVTITDAGGKSYLDMSGGAAVSCLGHGHPEVIAAVRSQLERLAFAHTAFFTSEPQEQLAEALVGRFGESGARVYFASGGSEANETALKLAWQYWNDRNRPQKKIIISREHSYHGNTFGALSVSGNDLRRRASAAPLLDWPRIPPCYEYRYRSDGETPEDYGQRAADYLDAAIMAAGADNVAAFICEPVVGSSLGVVPAAPGYLRRIREICDRHDVLLIADEIMCGSGRTGTFFAHTFDGVRPDIVTLAKGIGGGYQPLAAVVVGTTVAETLYSAGFAHGHTYIGHAAACAAGVAVLSVMQRDGLLARTEEIGRTFIDRIREAFAGHANVGDVRGRGLFAGIELVRDRDSKSGFEDANDLAERLRLAAVDEGLICYPGSIRVEGRTVPHIMLAPPMIVETVHIEQCLEILQRVLAQVLPS